MVARSLFQTVLLIFVFTFTSIFATTYYVDAVNGNDSNNGTSSSTAWKTLSKVNSTRYNPGDQILFNRGNTWNGQLVPTSSGTSTNRIIYGAYGTGAKPVITLVEKVPGSDNPSNWSKYSTNVYHMRTSVNFYNETRVWLGDKEYQWSVDGPGSLNSTVRWCVSGNDLYVYATDNPANAYSSIKYPGYAHYYTTLPLADKDYLTFQNLDIQGGFNTITFAGSDYIIMEDCNLGFGSHGRGIIGNSTSGGLSSSDGTSDYNIIRRDTLDSGWKVVTIENRQIMDAISLQNGANHWDITECYFKDWDHSSVQMYGITASVNYNRVFKCYITAPDIAFARSFEVMSMESGYAQYNEFFRNRINDITVRAQVGGYYTKMYYNIFSNMKNSITTYLDHKSAEGINIATIAGSVGYGIKVYNNTFYGLDRTGLWSYVSNSEFTNNLIIDCGREQSGLGIRVTDNGASNSVWKNNLIYTPGATKSSVIVNWAYSGKTIDQFNALNGSNGCSVSGNVQYTGTLSGLIKNAADGDYCPSTGSLAIKKGANVGATEDFYGNPISGTPDIGAIQSGSSAPTNDQSAPKIVNVTLINATSLKVTYSEQVSSDYAENINNYVISNSIKVTKAVLEQNKIDVTLTTTTHHEDVNYTISVSNVKDLAGNTISSLGNTFNYTFSNLTSTEENNTLSGVPSRFELNQNYPNPFNPTTKIKYAIAKPTNVTVKIYNMLGAEVMTLVNGEQTPGYYEVNFDGSKLASGTYIYQLKTNQYVETKKMMLIK